MPHTIVVYIYSTYILTIDSLFIQETSAYPYIFDDFRYVPKPYLEAEAKDSIDETSKKKKGKAPAQHKFDAFTFQGGSAFDG